MYYENETFDYKIGDNVIFNKNKCWKDEYGEYPCVIVGDEYAEHFKLFMDERFDDGISNNVSDSVSVPGGFTFTSYAGFFGLADKINFNFEAAELNALL